MSSGGRATISHRSASNTAIIPLLCLKKRPWNGLDANNAKARHPARKPVNSCARRFTTFARANTGRARPNRPWPSDFPRPAAPDSARLLPTRGARRRGSKRSLEAPGAGESRTHHQNVRRPEAKLYKMRAARPRLQRLCRAMPEPPPKSVLPHPVPPRRGRRLARARASAEHLPRQAGPGVIPHPNIYLVPRSLMAISATRFPNARAMVRSPSCGCSSPLAPAIVDGP